MAEELVHIATQVDQKTQRKFDQIAEKAHRSRADHLRFLIDKEIEFHEEREAGE